MSILYHREGNKSIAFEEEKYIVNIEGDISKAVGIMPTADIFF